jgi:hypothetical protein
MEKNLLPIKIRGQSQKKAKNRQRCGPNGFYSFRQLEQINGPKKQFDLLLAL